MVTLMFHDFLIACQELETINSACYKLKDMITAIKMWKAISFSKKANGGKNLRDTRVCQSYVRRDDQWYSKGS